MESRQFPSQEPTVNNFSDLTSARQAIYEVLDRLPPGAAAREQLQQAAMLISTARELLVAEGRS
jgi:hypothetical protein